MNAELNNNASIRVKDQQGNLKIKKREVFFLQKDEKKAILSLPGGVVEVDLDKIRLFLVGVNLIILAAATVSYLAWMDAKYNWQINSDEQPGRNVLRCLDELPELENNQQMIFKGIHCYLDPMLYLSSFNLLIYWIIYGVFISARFGGFCDICSVLMTLPHTLVIIIWEIGVAASIISVLFALKDLPWNELKEFSEQSYTDLRYIEEFYQRWGPWIAVLYILCFPVQISFVCLPFLMTRSPIETDSSSSKQITASNSTENPSQRGKDVVQGRYLIKIKEKFLDLLSKLINGSSKPTDNKQEIPTSCKRNDISDDSEYVCLEELDTSTADTDPELASLYQCEMPLEKLEHFKTQKLFSRVRRVSWRSGQTAGQAVLGTMQK
ncbi:uncharacterized protein LOC111705650 isoform X2 [Eurytemora carolleeae]|uniref:uncharacterized protein LOC111705650 isoform X2 n=1 Tax=Eurytemora carolleeae TaxID=1294199 RepID=UPI000C76F867|nr:uncharacterized protein LOC111705650 isoform X2 [Eurytemora carolleeae]|eukprot:XP_023334036.1 uncharacterized protein LOC111705650 isoform X2 [Eurytemora affinis]